MMVPYSDGKGGHRASKLMPHRDFLEAVRAEKSDVTLQALCARLSAEGGVKADTSMIQQDHRGRKARTRSVRFDLLVGWVIGGAARFWRRRLRVAGEQRIDELE